MGKNLRKSGARAAGQLKRDIGIAKSAGKKANKGGGNSSSLLERPWPTPQFAELPKDERDIVLERIEKEIAQPLAAAGSSIISSTSVSDSADIAAKIPHTRSALSPFVVRGVNSVARLVARRELRVVVFATNPESLPFAHVPLLCRLHRVPVCVLHLSSKAFGRLFGMRSLSVLGIKRMGTTSSSSSGDVGGADSTAAARETATSEAAAVDALSERERQQLESIAEFLIAKASKRLTSLS